MLLTRLLNACHRFPGFVYKGARLDESTKTIEIDVRPRHGSKPVCSGCGKPARGDDPLSQRRFEFIPIWGFAVLLLYRMRRVECRGCGIKVEEVPWGMGKHTLTRAYMLYLAHWAKKLSWLETARSFHTRWKKVCHAVEYVVQWGLEHRQLGPIRAIGVDELRDVLRYNLRSVRAYLLKEDFQRLWEYDSPTWAGKFLDQWCGEVMRSRIEPMKNSHARRARTASCYSIISGQKRHSQAVWWRG